MKKLIPALAAAAVAAASYLAYGTPVSDALAIALDKEKAIAACHKLLLPPAE